LLKDITIKRKNGKERQLDKLLNIQALRGLAVMLVVFYHSLAVEKKYNPDFVVIPDFFEIGGIGVDIFFIVSGFIMTFVTQEYFGNKCKFRKFIYARFSRIYPLYWLYTLLLVPVLLIKPEWVNSSQGGDIDVLSSFLLLPSDTLPLIMVAWTLVHEVYFYIIFGTLILFSKKKNLLAWSLVWLTIIILFNIFFTSNNPFTKLIFSTLTIEFIAGIWLAHYYLNYDRKFSFPRSLILIAFLSLFIVPYVFQSSISGEYSRLILYGIPSFFLTFSLLNAERFGVIFKGFISKIGDASYSIYLAHLLTLNVTAKIFNIFLFESYIFEVLMVTSMIFLTLVWGLYSYKYIEIPILRFMKKIGVRVGNA
jgi:exopolysaccharide production protein ExoZ